jgi:hypothetical protein
MHTIQATHSYEFLIANDYDVVLMRREVRQLARELGLGLAQQAKLAAAISMVARTLIAINQGTTIRMWTSELLACPTLEISCSMASQPLLEDSARLERELRFDEIRSLVDMATMSLDGSETLLTMRIQLNDQGRKHHDRYESTQPGAAPADGEPSPGA